MSDLDKDEDKKEDKESIIDAFKKNPFKVNKIYKEYFVGKGKHCIYCNTCKSCCCCLCEAEQMGMEYCSRFGGAGSGIRKNYGYLSAKLAGTFKKMNIGKVDVCEHCEHHIDEHIYIDHPKDAEYVNL